MVPGNLRKPVAILLFSAMAAHAQAPELHLTGIVERELQGGESHPYRLQVDSGQYLRVSAVQRGIDLRIALIGPDDKPLVEVDRVSGTEGVEDLPWIAAAAGEYRVVIGAGKQAKPGRYRLQLSDLRQPNDGDRKRVDAFRAAWMEARRLREVNTKDSLQAAAAAYEESLRLWRSLADPRWEAHALYQVSLIYDQLGRTPRARESLERALPLFRAAGERVNEASALHGLGYVNEEMAERRRAQDYYHQALTLRQALGDRAGEATTLNNLGLNDSALGDNGQALDHLQRALTLRRELGDRRSEASTLSNLAIIYRKIDQPEKALELDLEALKLRRAIGDRSGAANSLNGLGQLYYSLGDVTKAQEYWKEAETVYRETGYARGLSSVLNSLGNAADQFHRYREAVAYYERSLALDRQAANKQGEVSVMANMCSSLASLGEFARSREISEQALSIAREISFQRGIARALACLGEVDFRLGKLDEARDRYRESVAIHRATGDRNFLANALASLANVESDAGHLVDALAHAQEAVNLNDTDRAGVVNPDLRATYRAARAGRYLLQVDLLMRMHAADPARGYDALALETNERWRATSLIEMLAESRIDLRRELSPEQRRREDDILRRIRTAQQQRMRSDLAAARKPELEKQLAAAERDLELFQLELRTAGSSYASAQYPETLGADRIRREFLDRDSALVEYALGDRRSYVWAVTPDGLASAVLPARKQIEEQVAAYRKELSRSVSALTAASALARIDSSGRALYAAVLAPLAKSLARTKKLIVVPDGALAYLPFETLMGESRLIERFTLAYAPSASTLQSLRARTAGGARRTKNLLAFADPVYDVPAAKRAPVLAEYAERGFDFGPIPKTRVEVTAIRSLFPPAESRVYLGSEASERVLKTESLRDYRFLHFATHGYLDEEHPGRSGIVLSLGADPSEDGVLQVPEIMRLELNADLVTLSACQTGLGKMLAGEGVLGLTRAFLYAGARSVVVSLWNVNDSASAELMKSFYRHLSQGLPRDEALRRAKLSLLRGSQTAWRHPYYWAPFVLVGDAGAGPI